MATKIIPMSEKYRNKLVDYMHQKYPSFSDAYIQFDVNEAIGAKEKGTKSLIVINDNDEIVGCHLNFITKAWINGVEKDVVWGHNTYLDEEYRSTIGLDFTLEINSTKDGFGYNLSDVNTKIQKLFKTNVFVKGLRLYSIYKWSVFWGAIYKITGRIPAIPTELPLYVSTRKDSYKQCNSVKDLNIPNGGYWNREVCDVDFIRDEVFLTKRFFENPVNKYYVYTNRNKNCYFSVRPILHNGVLALQIADCRYVPHQSQIAFDIFKAIENLCVKIHAGVILFATSDKFFHNYFYGRKTCKSWPISLVCGKNNASSIDPYIIVNSADSDGEFH